MAVAGVQELFIFEFFCSFTFFFLPFSGRGGSEWSAQVEMEG